MRSIFFFAVLSFLFCACDSEERERQPGETMISGTVDNPVAGGNIILERMGAEGINVVDTTEADGNQFRFYVKEDAQAFYRINLYDRQYVTFIMSGEDQEVEIKADGSKPTGDFSVSGSEVNDQKNAIDQVEKDFVEKARELEQEFLDARETDDFEKMESVRQEYFNEEISKNRRMKEVIWEALPNLSAIYGTNYLDVNQEYQFMDSVATSLKESGQLQDYAKQIIDRVEVMRRLAIGSPAPDFTLPNPDGEMISLSSLQGKYVLIDFWAAWCRPCRMENPNVKKMYEAYSDKGFEILGVSLDRTKNAWLQAIKTDGLPWKHVSDLQYFNSEAARLYEIQAIPATYLIDPEGKIVAKGLRGPSLRAKLEEIFG